MKIEGALRLAVVLTALTLVGPSMSALATHNSVGAHVNIVQSDEVDEDGNLAPDIPRDPTHKYRFKWHENLPVDTGGDKDARLDPADQTGTRYNPDTGGCTAYGDGQQYDEETDPYDEDLRSGNACYVGYLDAQWEYLLYFSLLLTKQPSDSLYPVNPTPDDAYCQGEDPDDGDEEGPEETIPNRVNRSVEGALGSAGLGDADQCTGTGHTWFVPGDLGVDTDLLEPLQGLEQLQGESDTTLTDPGSGYITLPPLVTPHVFLYGQPHPDTPDDDLSGISAAEVNDQTAGLAFPSDDPCGERTQVCQLLSPEDIINYDDNNARLGDAAGFGEQARVCDFRPQFVTLNPDQRAAGLCGVFGDVVNQYIGTLQAGGLGLDEETGGAPTYVNTLPGWYEGVLMLIFGTAGNVQDVADEHTRVTLPPSGTSGAGFNLGGLVTDEDHDGELGVGIVQYTAVNPEVPLPNDALWCVRPNFMTSGADGFYGTYEAHAIDADVYGIAGGNQYEAVLGTTHDPVRQGVESPVAIPDEDPAGVGVPIDENGDDHLGLHDVESVYFFAQNASEGELPGPLQDPADRATFTESTDRDPDLVTPATAVTHNERFQQDVPAGLQCNASGVVQFSETAGDPLQGGLQFNVSVTQQTVTLKDPTVLDGELPARESDTERNGWQIDLYDFGGSIDTRTDTNENGHFDACAQANGQPQPDNDMCGWRALWDAYNSECTNIASTECGEIMEGLGYDLDAGVGLYFVVINDGPTLVRDQAAGATSAPNSVDILGEEDVNANNCIIGISTGFEAKLLTALNLGDQDGDGNVDEADLIDKHCGDVTGETVVIEDAFADQSGVNKGFFASDIQFGKLAPTPDAADDASQWEGFEVCVHGIWNVADDPETTETDIASDTEGNIELTGHNEFGDCDLFDDA